MKHTPKSHRNVALDILRGIAIVLVLGRHILVIPVTLPSAVREIFIWWRRFGWVGVDLFFVLSGFLVSGLLFQNYKRLGHTAPFNFLVRRGFKIYPAFYFFLAALLCSSKAFSGWPGPTPVSRFFVEALFIQNYGSGLSIHTWSLAVEEHYYLFLAILLAVLARANRGRADPFEALPKMVGILALVILCVRIFVGSSYPPGTWEKILPLSHLRFDSLLYGTLISYLFHFHRDEFCRTVSAYRQLLQLSTAVFLSPLLLFDLDTDRFLYTYGFSLLFLGFGNILALSIVAETKFESRILTRFRSLAPLGRHSYSIYLWHYPMFWWTTEYLSTTASFWLGLFYYLTGSLLAGFTSSLLIESPFLKYRDRKFPVLLDSASGKGSSR